MFESEYHMDNNGNTENIEAGDNSKLRDYKTVCAKLGLSMCVYFICRLLAGGVWYIFADAAEMLGETVYNIINTIVLVVMVYIIPIIFSATIFKSFETYKGNYKTLYKKPRRLARAMGTFPATFGFGHGIALLTLLASFLITKYIGEPAHIENLLRPPVIEQSTNIAGIITMMLLMVVIAPLFEEFWVRGIMYDALKPYGNGIAILISSLLFGLMHGSLYMIFYTTAYGLALGYIRYATDSLFIVTILHAIINTIGAGALLLISLMEITNEENRIINTINIIFLLAVLIMVIVGVVVFLSKIPAIRRFKIENTWTQISPRKKTAWFFASVPVILMMVLALNELTNNWLPNLLLS